MSIYRWCVAFESEDNIKKKMILGVLIIAGLMTGCKTTVEKPVDEEFWSKFEIVEKRHDLADGYLYTVYDNETRVMYYIMRGGNQATMSPVYNSDGTVMIYEGNEN